MSDSTNSTTQPTPGPWRAFYDSNARQWVIDNFSPRSGNYDGLLVGHFGEGAHSESNAHLIAAVHELRDALYAYVKPDGCFCDDPDFPCRYCVGEAALAKATGEARK